MNGKENMQNTIYYHFDFLRFVNCGDYIGKFYVDYPEQEKYERISSDFCFCRKTNESYVLRKN